MKDYEHSLRMFVILLERIYPDASLTQLDIAARLLQGGWYLTLEELMDTALRLTWEDKR